MWWFLLVSAALADSLGDALDRALELESAGDPAAARDELLPWMSTYPQDFSLALRVGWLAWLAEDWGTAERAYSRAAELSGGGLEARLGLAWTHLKMGEITQARSEAAALQTDHPDDARITELIHALPQSAWSAGGNGIVVFLAPHHAADLGVGGRIRAEGRGEHASGGLAIEYLHYLGVAATPVPNDTVSVRQNRYGQQAGTQDGVQAGETRRPWEEEAASGSPWSATTPASELGADISVWGNAGVGGDRAGVEIVGAALLHTTDLAGTGFVAGALGRVEAAGTLSAELSLTRPRSAAANVWRVAPSWFIPVGPLALQPGAALQVARNSVLPSGSLTVWALPEGWGLWAGGSFGPEWYRTSLALRSAAAWPDLTRASAWAGLRVGALDRTWVSLGWSTDILDPDGSGSLDPVPAHGVVLSAQIPL